MNVAVTACGWSRGEEEEIARRGVSTVVERL